MKLNQFYCVGNRKIYTVPYKDMKSRVVSNKKVGKVYMLSAICPDDDYKMNKIVSKDDYDKFNSK